MTMTRLRSVWLPVLLQAVLGLSACGEDDDDGDDDVRTDASVDGGRSDAAVVTPTDAGTDASAAPAKVTNVLAQCSASAQCMGTAATCDTGLALGPAATAVTTPYPGGGACSATCSKASDCGPGGTCPVGEAITIGGAPAQMALGTVGHCSRSCSLTPPSGCPTGYACLTLNILSQQRGETPMPFPFLNAPFCLPLPRPDGGVPDGGTTSQVSLGMDAGL